MFLQPRHTQTELHGYSVRALTTDICDVSRKKLAPNVVIAANIGLYLIN